MRLIPRHRHHRRSKGPRIAISEAEISADLHYPAGFRERLARYVFTHPALGYLGLISLVTALGVASLLAYASRQGGGPWLIVFVAVVTLIPVSELTISLLNLILTSQVSPRPLPKLDMRGGIPANKNGIRFFHATQARATGNTAVQIDGELLGNLPMSFEIAAHKLDVFV